MHICTWVESSFPSSDYCVYGYRFQDTIKKTISMLLTEIVYVFLLKNDKLVASGVKIIHNKWIWGKMNKKLKLIVKYSICN